MTNKARKPRKKKEPLHGMLSSGVIFVGDAEFFAGSPVIELNPATGAAEDVTPVDPLNPFNTLDRTLAKVGDGEANVELGPYMPGRGVLLNTHLQGGKFIIKKKMKNGVLVGYDIRLIS